MKRVNLKRIISLRHELHEYPELSLCESGTIRRLIDFLKRHTSLKIVEAEGWFYAVKLGNDPGAAPIAFRADMDALPIDETGMPLACASRSAGVSHKCGHDGHCAALCGLALELEGVKTERTVYLIFQCAEEIGVGALRAAGLIDEMGIREIYAFHNLSGYPAGTIAYRHGLTQPASEGLTLCFQGTPSHASAPEEGRNPADILAGTVLRVDELLKAPHEGMVLCTVVGMTLGAGDFGVSPGEGKLMLTLRAEVEAEMKALEADILSFAGAAADEQGIEMTHQISDAFPETRNTGAGIARVLSAAAKLGIPAVEMESIWRGSEDFGHYLKRCEGAIFYIGNGEDWPNIHTVDYDFNDDILETAVDMFSALCT